jgi:hypothetical protein
MKLHKKNNIRMSKHNNLSTKTGNTSIMQGGHVCYGEKLYSNAVRSFVLPENRNAHLQLGKFMDLIETMPSPMREEAFISFCLGSLKNSAPFLKKAA